MPAINAFALPGGYIYITRGILPFLDDEAQLAGVLGHEIGHVTARHAAQQYSRSTGAGLGLILGSIFVPQARPLAQLGESGLGVLFLKYGRDDEAQADGLGVKYASRAGWDPAGMPQMLTTLGRIEEASDNKGVPNWLSTHPAPEDRVQRVQAAVRDAEAGAERFTTDRDGYLKRIDGLVYGDNPGAGRRPRQQLPARQPALRDRLPAGLGREQRARRRSWPKEPGVNAFMILLQHLQRPVGADDPGRGAPFDGGRRLPRARRRRDDDQRPRRVRRHLSGLAAGSRPRPRARRPHRARAGRVSRGRHRAAADVRARRAELRQDDQLVPADDARRSRRHPSEPHRALHGARRRHLAVDRRARRAQAS